MNRKAMRGMMMMATTTMMIKEQELMARVKNE